MRVRAHMCLLTPASAKARAGLQASPPVADGISSHALPAQPERQLVYTEPTSVGAASGKPPATAKVKKTPDILSL